MPVVAARLEARLLGRPSSQRVGFCDAVQGPCSLVTWDCTRAHSFTTCPQWEVTAASGHVPFKRLQLPD